MFSNHCKYSIKLQTKIILETRSTGIRNKLIIHIENELPNYEGLDVRPVYL
jgi:hypothetical protein